MVREESIYKNTKVFIRFLPMYNMNWENIKILEDRKTLYMRCLQDFEKGKEDVVPSFWKFQSDGVFYNTSQNDIFGQVISDQIFEKVLEGNNAIILSYGQTASGKTVTTGGLQNCFDDRGIIPRVIETLYQIKEEAKGKFQLCIHLQYVETNRNYIMDLLSNNDKLYDMNSIGKIKSVKVKSFERAMKIIFKAEAMKTIRSRENYNSNMANSVLTLIINRKYASSMDTTTGTLHIVDLCGGDTIGNMTCYHKNGLEVGNGNLAKTQLEQFLLILNQKNTVHILAKQRLCIIVQYLKNALNACSILRFIGHIRIPFEDMKVTISMLRFAQLVRGLVPEKLHPKIFNDTESLTKMLEDKVVIMKKERDLNSMIRNEDLSLNLSQERYEYVQKLAQDYLQEKNGEIVILNTTDAIMAMQVFKNIYGQVQSERDYLQEQIKLLEIESEQSRGTISTSSKARNSSKHNSSASLIKSKKGSSKKRGSKNSLGSKDGSIKSGRTNTIRRKTSKRKSLDSSNIQKSETSMLSTPAPGLPETIPNHDEVWLEFTQDPDYNYNNLKADFDQYELELTNTNNTYLEEVKQLNEVMEVVHIRREEAYKAFLLKDLEVDGETELELKCNDNLAKANAEMITQKEKLLKIQTDMRITIDCKKNVRLEIDKKYEEFCLKKYNIPVPDLENDYKMVNEAPPNKDEDTSKSQIEENVVDTKFSKNLLMFNELKKYMLDEYEKKIRKNVRNQKWIQSCKMLE